MKKITWLMLAFCMAAMFVFAQNAKRITMIISNPHSATRTGALVSVSWKDVLSRYPGIDTGRFKVIDVATGKEIPFQLERRGSPSILNLLVQVDVKEKSSVRLAISAGKSAPVVTRTFARFVPERFDDFAWENDKVAYRMYGKALETRKDNAFGTDVWVKRTDRMVINDWYKSGDYHTDHGEGMDYYSVGLTLGGGDIAPYVNDSIYFSKNYQYWKILDNGPLRSTFELGYDEWDAAGRKVKVTKRISLDAGSHMNRVEANYAFDGSAELPVVMGIVKRKDPGAIWLGETQGVMAYWEPANGTNGVNGSTGVATIIPGGSAVMSTDRSHLLTHTIATNGNPVIYYNGSAWDKGKHIKDARAWFDYLANFKSQLQQPLTVTWQ